MGELEGARDAPPSSITDKAERIARSTVARRLGAAARLWRGRPLRSPAADRTSRGVVLLLLNHDELLLARLELSFKSLNRRRVRCIGQLHTQGRLLLLDLLLLAGKFAGLRLRSGLPGTDGADCDTCSDCPNEEDHPERGRNKRQSALVLVLAERVELPLVLLA